MDLDAFRLIGFVTEEMTAVMEVTNLTVALATNLTAEMANVSSNQRCVMACMTAATKKTKKIVQVQRAQVQLGQIQQVLRVLWCAVVANSTTI